MRVKGAWVMFFGTQDLDIKIQSIHLLSWQGRDVDIPPKSSFALSYRAVGDSRFLTDGEVVEAGDGDILYFPKGAGYHLDAGCERLWGINFEASGDMPERIMKFSTKKRQFFETAFSEIYRVWTERESGYYARAMSYFYRIIAEMEREFEDEKHGAAYLKLKPALSLIYSGYMDPSLSVASLAEHIGVSDTYFRRIFEAETGERPLEFINKLRVSYAKEHLESGFYNVERTAEVCGFRDAKYFSTVFRRLTGMSPSEYMKKHI